MRSLEDCDHKLGGTDSNDLLVVSWHSHHNWNFKFQLLSGGTSRRIKCLEINLSLRRNKILAWNLPKRSYLIKCIGAEVTRRNWCDPCKIPVRDLKDKGRNLYVSFHDMIRNTHHFDFFYTPRKRY